MAVSKRLRFEILRRDGHRCRYCGAGVSDAILTVDHVTPVALGGTDKADNLVAACEDCNAGKTSTMPDGPVVAAVADDAVRWAMAVKQAAAEMEAQEEPKLAYRAAFKEAWDSWTYPSGNSRKTFDLPADWRIGIERYRLAGLPASAWPDVVEPGMANKKVSADNIFRYMCGVANKRVEEVHERARGILGVSAERHAQMPGLDLFAQAVAGVWEAAWTGEFDESPSDEQRANFRASLSQLREGEDAQRVAHEPHRLMQAVHRGAMVQASTIKECLDVQEQEERYDIVMTWADAWRFTCESYPDGALYSVVSQNCDDLYEAGVHKSRVELAAIIAGYHLSTEPHFGVNNEALATAGVVAFRENAVDFWSRSFACSALAWPTAEQRSAMAKSLDRIINDGQHFVADIYMAAVAAGAYQDPDLSPCLPHQLSVFKAAELLLQPSN
ncbi:HNH endonuclease [Streptacidiphilus sp. EB129]|uniref:HNH endonuclease n=1 Tax=Streptacidiphilus sp. EB129 TaxID=3156262 RepID=UPI0035139C7E